MVSSPFPPPQLRPYLYQLFNICCLRGTKGATCLHRSEGLVEPQEEARGRVGKDQRRCPFLLTVCPNVFLIPFMTVDEREGGSGRPVPYRASAKIDTFCLQIISFLFL